jgi:hypothetical protein
MPGAAWPPLTRASQHARQKLGLRPFGQYVNNLIYMVGGTMFIVIPSDGIASVPTINSVR